MGWPACPICDSWPGGPLEGKLYCKQCLADIPTDEARSRLCGAIQKRLNAKRRHTTATLLWEVRERIDAAELALAKYAQEPVALNADEWRIVAKWLWDKLDNDKE